MNKYDIHIKNGIELILSKVDEIKLSYLGNLLKKYLMVNSIFFIVKNKRTSPNSYLKYKHNGLLNFIKLNTGYLIFDKDKHTMIKKFN